jgi:electron transfer flavoprotein beta subunit
LRLAAADAKIETWSNQVLKLDEQSVGLKGSPTWVVRIFSPQREKGEILGDGLGDPEGTARLLVERLVAKDALPA